jgi:hypothetical protein
MAHIAVTQGVLVSMVREVNLSHFTAINKNDFGAFVFSSDIGSNNRRVS